MNISALWDAFSLWVMHAGMPAVQCYHLLCGSPFLNVAAEDAEGLEMVANQVLAPVQYLLAGSKAVREIVGEGSEEGNITYRLDQRFDYKDEYIWTKTALSYVALPSSLIVGSALKGLSYISERTRQHHFDIVAAKRAPTVHSRRAYYEAKGIKFVSLDEAEYIAPPVHKRRPGEENTLQIEKEALKQVVKLLKENEIMFWMDCGSCLGAYRYGGIIPWDWDIDIAILQPDFENVRQVLSQLDPERYVVQDWSSRDRPSTYLKVYVKETGTLIDIYHFGIDDKNRCIYSILSNEGSIFLPESWKIRERRFTIPTSYDIVFPLKRAVFDGIEVFVPGRTKEYLQQRYGENIEPAKIYNELTGSYEKDLSHPYWQRAYVQ